MALVRPLDVRRQIRPARQAFGFVHCAARDTATSMSLELTAANCTGLLITSLGAK
jgi:hypothetical protein